MPLSAAQLEVALTLARPNSLPHRWDGKLSRLLNRVLEIADELGLERVRLEALGQLQAIDDQPFQPL